MFRKILLTLDGSELARRALPYARDLARSGGGEVCVLEVIDSLDDVMRELAGDTTKLSSQERTQIGERASVLLQLQREEATRDVEDARRELEAAGARTDTLIEEGRPAEQIVAAAQRLGCDAIVMGARGHSGMEREAIGSVAESVVLNAVGVAVIIVGPRATGAHGPRLFGARTVSAPAAQSGRDG
jgi:nucleotide-binding universal stress UspA family protein